MTNSSWFSTIALHDKLIVSQCIESIKPLRSNKTSKRDSKIWKKDLSVV